MPTSLVLTVIGSDQPGLVEAVAQTVAAHGGSWESSRMSRLAGFFAGILEVSVPAEASASLFKALHELEERGLRVVVEDARGDSEISAYRELCLELVGQDRRYLGGIGGCRGQCCGTIDGVLERPDVRGASLQCDGSASPSDLELRG